ncbi:MAG TPA: hypothetical protein VNK43_08975, partial [Gemmatimonadales bacterium]|nr:hypothetical protein [Gemmatimonadales bacterium]
MTRTRLFILPAAVALLAGTVHGAVHPLPAQGPAERAALERFRDSLAQTRDSLGLLALERREIERAKRARDDA